MALITISELKAVLGIGDIYADAIVQEVADAAENILLSLLVKNQYSIVARERVGTVATLYTDRVNDFYVGQTLTVDGCGAHFNGTHTITKRTDYSFSFAIVTGTNPKQAVVPYGFANDVEFVDLETVPEIHEACLAIACDIWITRTGTLGQQGVDFQSPAPYRLGRSLFTRVSGLLGKWMDTRGMVG
jgi:hypothetical protein